MVTYDHKKSEFGSYIVIIEGGNIVNLYFSEKKPKGNQVVIDIEKYKIAPQGTDFQKKVWNALLKIPKGKTVTYSELAKKIGAPKAVRAVASAVAKNKIALLIPCHRVVPKTGGTGKYRWGTNRKKKILESEYDTMKK
jgi:O-6-methylguanine DNA methyltransferase